MLALWIDHLAISAAGLWRDGETSLLLCRDRSWRLPPLEISQARAQLADYCQLYRQGLVRPLPVFPDASYIVASESQRDKALARALRSWHSSWGSGGDPVDPYIRLVLRSGFDLPIGGQAFADCAQRLYARLLESRQPA